MNIGLIGASGYWGPKLLKAAADLESARVVCCSAGHDLERLTRVVSQLAPADQVPALMLRTDVLLSRRGLDAVIVAAPAENHFEIAHAALVAGKHVFLEKPMCLSHEDAVELATLANEHGKILLVDHTYIFSKCLAYMKARIDDGSIGVPLMAHSQRTQMGIYRQHGVLWDLAPHDLSILTYLFPEESITAVRCQVASHFGGKKKTPPDEAIYGLSLSNGIRSSGVLSWCQPRCSRDFAVAGTDGMLLFEQNSIVKRFHRNSPGVSVPDREHWKLCEEYAPEDNPLRNALSTFVESVAVGGQGVPAYCRPEFGVRIVDEIEQLHRSAQHW
ncbi:MAG: Gfo/Idh/MocA family protein [Planctomycetaceae bacterium]